LNAVPEKRNPPRAESRLVWGLALGGLILRVIFVLLTQNIGGVASLDASTYHHIACNLLAGAGFSEDGTHPSLFVAPLYPFFMAAVYGLAGVHPVVVELLQCLFGTATALVVWQLTRSYGGRLPALIALVLTLFIPELFVLTTYMYTETIFILLFVLSIWLALRALRRPVPGRLALAGLAGGLATLTRGVTMLLPLLFFAALLLHREGLAALRQALLFALFFALPILPWTFRNYQTFHAVVPVAVGSGDVLWTGNYLPLDGKYSYDKTMAIMDSMTAGLNQVERDRRLTRAALDNIKAAPLASAGLMVRKFFRFWLWVYEGAPTGMQRQGGGLVQVVLAVSYYPVLLLFGVGLWLTRSRWREFFFIYLLLAYYVAAHVALLVVPRYRFPILPLMIFFASLALAEAWGRWKRWRAA